MNLLHRPKVEPLDLVTIESRLGDVPPSRVTRTAGAVPAMPLRERLFGDLSNGLGIADDGWDGPAYLIPAKDLT